MTMMILVGVCAALAAGVIVGVLMAHRLSAAETARHETENARAVAEATVAAKSEEIVRLVAEGRAAVETFGQRIAGLEEENGRLKTERARQDEMLASERKRIVDMEVHYQKTREAAKAEFEMLAQKVLDARTEKLKTEGREQLKGVVDGLAADIKAFREKIAASDLESAKNTTELKTRIGELVGQTAAVTSQANNLADAIRGEAQLTGEWGEIQLRRVLECAGVAEGVGYTYQETFLDPETGRRSKRTDFVVNMPEGRRLIIDSKATVEAARDYHAAKTKEEKEAALASVILSVERHIDEIRTANYPAVVPDSLPVVLMYIPVDEVYILAMKAKVSARNSGELVREYAMRHNVVLVNSASVIPVMRLVEMMWNAEKARKNNAVIISTAQELLRRCNAFVQSFLDMGEAFDAAGRSYAEAKSKLVDAPGGQSILKAANALIGLGVEPKTKQGRPLEVAKAIAEAKPEH